MYMYIYIYIYLKIQGHFTCPKYMLHPNLAALKLDVIFLPKVMCSDLYS